MARSIFLTAYSVLACILTCASADTVANCTYRNIRGSWIIELGPWNNDRTLNCSKPFQVMETLTFKLTYPDIAIDQFNNKGHWTVIYNQGFEFQVVGRKYFGFSYYEGQTSYCHKVVGGWSHNLLGRNWACFNATKSVNVTKLNEYVPQNSTDIGFRPNSEDMVEKINQVQNSWTAKRYSRFDNLTQEDFINIAGGRKSQIFSRPDPVPLTVEHNRIAQNLPEFFDWRNVSGVNYISPVRDQGVSCGSCYAFASVAMAEARVRIQTNNTQTPVFSPQDVIECSRYSQGCDGGFPYLVAGKYAEDYGFVLEECNPYKGSDGKCRTDPTCARYYFTDYSYIGGFYGGCNEVLMQQAIYQRGPIAACFMTDDDFLFYASGVYHHADIGVEANRFSRFNPFVMTDHAVLIVGWGQLPAEEGGTKYWVVKNTFGSEWGLDGYFWIRRGVNECGIESSAVESTPIY